MHKIMLVNGTMLICSDENVLVGAIFSLWLTASLLQDIVAGLALHLFSVCLLWKGKYQVKQRRTETKITALSQDL